MISPRAGVLAILLGGIVLWGLWVLADGYRPYLRSMTPTSVEIPPGTSTLRIAQQLEDVGAIRSSQTFLLLHFLRPRQTLKAGEYSFDYPASAADVLRKLVLGEASYEQLTVPEGFNRFAIADLVESGGFATREEFLRASSDTTLVADLDPQAASLEGYLFPDTYQFPRHVGAARVARAMVNRFRQVYAGLISPGSGTPPAREIVTMASLVEEETGKAEERPLVASVFYNRLKRGIPLQCDPTVVYAAILEKRYDGKIRQSQLNSASPYNTYLHPGLPPGPIANPGKASLVAALHPASSKYLYFVANPAGNHSFSKTLTEHNLAVGLYRRSLPH